MCYSKEVQLVTSLIILFSSLFYYIHYSRKYRHSKEQWLLPFLHAVLLGFVCIGLHQFFEFLALVTKSEVVYKTGLIISVCAVYFLLRSLEELTNTRLYSKFALVPIAAVSLQILFSPMGFEAVSFYLRHNSAFFWIATWLLLFFYWNVCAIKIYAGLKDKTSRRTLLLYMLMVADISFLLSALYVIAGYFLFSVNVCTDSPSIWCTFFVLQSFLVPAVLSRLPALFKRNGKPAALKHVWLYILLAAGILLVLLLTLPLFKCLTLKFVFP